MTEASEKKDVQKLQRVVIDSLEDIKAQDIQAFNTEHLSALFERVIIASGTSNRQTKALAASVRDEVRDAGFGKPRIEGEENGEWIIVDCGAVVVHIMQPSIRQYYHLEEIWGEKPVRLKLGSAKPPMPVKVIAPPEPTGKAAKKAPAKKSSKPASKTKPGLSPKATAAPAKKASTAKPAAPKPVAKVPAKKVAAQKSSAAKPTAKKSPRAKV
jgi:ribosome-associated protein